MSTNDLITFIANIALTMSFIVALIFGVAQVNAASRDRRERLTIETLRNYQTAEFAQLAIYINTHRLPKNYKEMQALPIDEQVMLFQFAQQMESLGILVADKVIDIDLVDKTLGSYVMTTWKKYKVMFTTMREELPDPFLGEYFQWLAEVIDKRMKEDPRQPYFVDHKA